jgi:hypothetical protein
MPLYHKKSKTSQNHKKCQIKINQSLHAIQKPYSHNPNSNQPQKASKNKHKRKGQRNGKSLESLPKRKSDSVQLLGLKGVAKKEERRKTPTLNLILKRTEECVGRS